MSKHTSRLDRIERALAVGGDDAGPMYVVVEDGDPLPDLQGTGPIKGYIRTPGFNGPDDWPQAPDRGHL